MDTLRERQRECAVTRKERQVADSKGSRARRVAPRHGLGRQVARVALAIGGGRGRLLGLHAEQGSCDRNGVARVVPERRYRLPNPTKKHGVGHRTVVLRLHDRPRVSHRRSMQRERDLAWLRQRTDRPTPRRQRLRRTARLGFARQRSGAVEASLNQCGTDGGDAIVGNGVVFGNSTLIAGAAGSAIARAARLPKRVRRRTGRFESRAM